MAAVTEVAMAVEKNKSIIKVFNYKRNTKSFQIEGRARAGRCLFFDLHFLLS
jgi:hypothetical protein